MSPCAPIGEQHPIHVEGATTIAIAQRTESRAAAVKPAQDTRHRLGTSMRHQEARQARWKQRLNLPIRKHITGVKLVTRFAEPPRFNDGRNLARNAVLRKSCLRTQYLDELISADSDELDCGTRWRSKRDRSA